MTHRSTSRFLPACSPAQTSTAPGQPTTHNTPGGSDQNASHAWYSTSNFAVKSESVENLQGFSRNWAYQQNQQTAEKRNLWRIFLLLKKCQPLQFNANFANKECAAIDELL